MAAAAPATDWTPLSYACCFGMQQAVRAMLATRNGIVSLNNVDHACRRTGFLPLHAVTANRLRHMYQFLTGETLDEPANPQLAVCASHLGQNDNHLAGLKPLALAASRGSENFGVVRADL